jgi:hypothetical protein
LSRLARNTSGGASTPYAHARRSAERRPDADRTGRREEALRTLPVPRPY